MTIVKKAKNLIEVASQIALTPLQSDDPRYVDLSSGRSGTELAKLRVHLDDFNAQENSFARVAFTGNRGCGKSTELLRLERDLHDTFTPLHLTVDDALVRDCDYTELLLWLVDSVAEAFEKTFKTPLNPELLKDVANWFADTSLEDVTSVKKEIKLEAEAEAKAKGSVYFFSAKLLSRLKSMISGSKERRTTIRRNLQTYADDLIAKVNLLLDDAQRILEERGRGKGLLIVQDNLDRLSGEVARRLFFEGSDSLKKLRAHVVYTVPIALVMSPGNIGATFEHYFTMPMVKVHDRHNVDYELGLESLVTLIGARVDLDLVFMDRDVPRFLAGKSGGSIRDLMRLLSYARLAALVDKKDKIDMASAQAGAVQLRNDFQGILVPGEVYYPLLARLHQTKEFMLAKGSKSDTSDVQSARDFFSQLLLNGSVLEYNGAGCWHDVHPIVQDIEAFKRAAGHLHNIIAP